MSELLGNRTTAPDSLKPYQPASHRERSDTGAMPNSGPMVRPFPQPGTLVRSAIGELQHILNQPPEDENELRQLELLPRPWDPGTCTGQLRAELWEWLDRTAIWINNQHLWNLQRPGIPSCWPAHPNLVHDLAVLTCTRYIAGSTLTPDALAEWHGATLPGFLYRLNERLGDTCQPGRHEPSPRHERDQKHIEEQQRQCRRQRYADDVEFADRAANLHQDWTNFSPSPRSNFR